MAYDAARQRIVLFGGYGGASVLLADTWEWDGVNWAQRNPTMSRPHAISTQWPSTLGKRVLVFGGKGSLTGGELGDIWLHGNLVLAATQTIGTACAGTNGSPVIASNVPFLGNQAFALDLLSARGAAPCLCMLATGTQAANLGGGCTLYLNGVFVPLLTARNASGFVSLKFAIPLDPALRGGAAYAQGFVFDPMGSFADLALTRRAEARVRRLSSVAAASAAANRIAADSLAVTAVTIRSPARGPSGRRARRPPRSRAA